MNFEMYAAIAVIVAIAVWFGYQYFRKQKKATSTTSALGSIADIKAELSAHIESAVLNAVVGAKADIAKLATALKQHPAAPAASVAVPPPAVAPSEPSAGGGGTTLFVTAADAVLAKHAQLDALIAAGVAAQAQKDALTAKQAELNALVA